MISFIAGGLAVIIFLLIGYIILYRIPESFEIRYKKKKDNNDIRKT